MLRAQDLLASNNNNSNNNSSNNRNNNGNLEKNQVYCLIIKKFKVQIFFF